MSFKAKNLAYEANEPAFLQRLRAGVASGDTDRHERPIARPKRLKKDGDEEDDAPTYVLEESGESMSKAEYEALQKAQEPGGDEVNNEAGADVKSTTEDDTSEVKSNKHTADIGQLQRKRKAGKVVGERDDDEPVSVEGEQKKAKPTTKKAAKKAKAVKLSFGDD